MHEQYLREDDRYPRRYLDFQAGVSHLLDYHSDSGFRTTAAVIPVVVHVVYNTPEENVPDANIAKLLDALNVHFSRGNADVINTPAVYLPLTADAGIQFKLAVRGPDCKPTTGITRTQTSVTSWNVFATSDYKKTAAGGIDPWPTDRYLNIWVINSTNGYSFAPYPPVSPQLDGVALAHFTLPGLPGDPNGYQRGRGAVHEFGHYFGLRHIWGDVHDCANTTDYVADTPNQLYEHYDCPTFPVVSCPTQSPDGDMHMNFMDYGYEQCKLMFTIGQVARMQTTLTTYRRSLLASDGLVPAPSPDVADLWAAVSPADTGAEPYPVPGAIWQSEDIWVRTGQDGLTVHDHQNPVHRPSGAANYVYVRVRNRSCAIAGEGTVKLYWAKASTGLGWPQPWDGTVTVPALMGGLVDQKPTGSIAGRGSTVLEFSWSPPDPADYSSFGGDKNHFCLLARIETASSAPYGMTVPEGPDLHANVRNNNNIVWKNVEVLSGTEGAPGFVTVGNPTDEQRRIQLSVLAGRRAGQGAGKQAPVYVEIEGDLVDQLDLEGPAAKVVDGRLLVYEFGVPFATTRLEPHEHHTVTARFGSADDIPLGVGVHVLDIVVHDAGTGEVSGGQTIAFRIGADREPRVAVTGPWRSHDGGETYVPAGAHAQDIAFDLRSDHTAVLLDDGDRIPGFWHREDAERVVLGFADADRPDRVLRVATGPDGSAVLRG